GLADRADRPCGAQALQRKNAHRRARLSRRGAIGARSAGASIAAGEALCARMVLISHSKKILTRALAHTTRTPSSTTRHILGAFRADHPDFCLQATPGGKIASPRALLRRAHTFGSDFVGPKKWSPQNIPGLLFLGQFFPHSGEFSAQEIAVF